MVKSWIFKALMTISRPDSGLKESRSAGKVDYLSENGASRTTYVSRPTTAGLKSCERWQLNQGAVKAPSFVSVDQSTFDKQNIVITKGDVRIEFPCDTNIGTVTNIIGALLC